MSRLQIIVLVAAVALVAGIYSLPKVIIQNNKVLADNGNKADTTTTTTEEEAHHVDLKPETRQRIAEWNKKIAAGDLSVVDSVMAAYSAASAFDSAAYIAEKTVDEKDENSLLKVAEAYYRAFGFATDANQSEELAVKARGFYEKALAINPDNKDARSDMAMTYVTSNNPMQGILMLREIAEKDPKHVKSQLNLGLLSVQSKQFDKALVRFENVLKLDPNHTEASYYKGVVLMELGKAEEAKKVFNQLLDKKDIDPAIKQSVEAYLKEIV